MHLTRGHGFDSLLLFPVIRWMFEHWSNRHWSLAFFRAHLLSINYLARERIPLMLMVFVWQCSVTTKQEKGFLAERSNRQQYKLQRGPIDANVLCHIIDMHNTMISIIWRSMALLTLRIDGSDAFGCADIPHPDRLVSWCGHKQVGVGWMPTQLVHTVSVAPVVILFDLGNKL